MGKVLSFPKKKGSEIPLSREAISAIASDSLRAFAKDSGEADWSALLNPEVLSTVIASLRAQQNATPSEVSRQALQIHNWISRSEGKVGVFDETDYFLGELALIAGSALRYLGEFDVAEAWLDRADASFRQTVNPAAMSARVAYARMTIRFDRREIDRVLEMAPLLARNFEALDMTAELRKTRFVEAMALKEAGNFELAFNRFQSLRSQLAEGDGSLLGRVLIEIGAEHARNERFGEAAPIYEEAIRHASMAGDEMSLAHLRGTVADTYRSMGRFDTAIDCYRAALEGFKDLGMKPKEAYYRVIVAESLLLANRPKEAEWEIRAAMPIIDEARLAAEGIAALALLRKALEARNLSANVLRGVREQIAAGA